MSRLHVVAFGCQMSAADGEELARPLLARGLSLADTPQEADAIIVNTCTVRQHAEDRALSFLGRLGPWKEARPDGLLIVTGCAAERLGERLRRRFPFIDLVVGAKSIEDYPRLLEEALRKRFDWKAENRRAWPAVAREAKLRAPIAAAVTVMRGCNHACSYCIVPAVRGRELYRPFEAVVEEARRRAAEGARELMLLGQTVNRYRAPDGRDFADLLRAVAAVGGVARVRFMSPHPRYVGARMIEAMAGTPAVCPHLHLPAQSGSDRVLRAMRRGYGASAFLDKVAALRRAIPRLAISTDAIAGFPGETERDFEATLELLRALDPAFTYCFKFSPREGTEAAGLPGALPEPVKQERLRRLLALTEPGRLAHLERRVGQRVRVLLEDRRHGRTDDFFPAKLDGEGRPGETIEGVVIGAKPTGLLVRAAESA